MPLKLLAGTFVRSAPWRTAPWKSTVNPWPRITTAA